MRKFHAELSFVSVNLKIISCISCTKEKVSCLFVQKPLQAGSIYGKNTEPEIRVTIIFQGRSQWPLGLRNELSSLARTLGSRVRIPLKAWISVCVYSMFVLFCVLAAALRRADPPIKESYRLCMD
jgi:hypothetical protein